MVEVPDHLLQRAAEARARLGGEEAAASASADQEQQAAADAPAPEATADQVSEAGKVPSGLLERTAPAVATATAPAPTGPGGHTQRLLTVVKAGSIQDVRATPVDKVHTWPHLLLAEFVAALLITGFLLIFSIFVNAPLLELANFNETTNPSKAPWYFLGLQELLTMFHPMIAGVTIPGIGIFLLILTPYVDKNPERAPERRKFAVSIMTVHLMFWATLVIIGSFFRGPGFNFIFPWESGLFFDL